MSIYYDPDAYERAAARAEALLRDLQHLRDLTYGIVALLDADQPVPPDVRAAAWAASMGEPRP